MITIALPKGRLSEETISILQKSYPDLEIPKEENRELSYTSKDGRFRFLSVRSNDVGTYIQFGVADLGIIGWDTYLENGYELFCIQDLNIGKCRLSIAAKPGFSLEGYSRKLRVATKFPKLTREYFGAKGISIEIIKLYGSVELAPILGLSDCIVDLVSTGGTLKANGLVEVETILESTARLVTSESSFYTRNPEIQTLLKDFAVG